MSSTPGAPPTQVSPLPPPAPRGPQNVLPSDNTLTLTPHVISVIVGGILGFVSTKVPFLAPYTAWASPLVAAGITSFAHWIQAKAAE